LAKVKAFLNAQLHITASIFQSNKLGWLLGLVECIQSEQYPWYWRKWSNIFISDFYMRASLGCGNVGRFHCKFCHLLSGSYWMKASCFISSDNFWQKVLCQWTRKTGTNNNAPRCRNVFISTTTSIQLTLMHWNHNWCQLKHAQTYLNYHHVTWLPLSHAMK
jgi:hypothetical protein